jgi:hypothetical protein
MRIILAIISIGLFSCEEEQALKNTLTSHRWKVVKTTYESANGQKTITVGEHNGGFYITLKDGNEFIQEWFPYSFTLYGDWHYSSADQKLALVGPNGDFKFEYTVRVLTDAQLVLEQPGDQDVNGYIKVSQELMPVN